VPGDVFRDAKLLGFINKVAANLYRDPALNLFGAAEKVKALINAHILARGVDPKIPPTAITDADFEKVLQAQSSTRARAAQNRTECGHRKTDAIHPNRTFSGPRGLVLSELEIDVFRISASTTFKRSEIVCRRCGLNPN
jgi:type I restriction enzyme R subunit